MKWLKSLESRLTVNHVLHDLTARRLPFLTVGEHDLSKSHPSQHLPVCLGMSGNKSSKVTHLLAGPQFLNLLFPSTHWLRVRVPVLSEASTSIPDISSRADSLSTVATKEVSVVRTINFLPLDSMH
eukprot:1138531-Pelagomonas_calceolata.AAC.6